MVIQTSGPQHWPSALVDLKERNEWRVIETLRAAGEVTRAELVGLTGLSRSTIANVVVELQRRDIVEERVPAIRRRAGRGRPGTAVRLRVDAGVAVGVAIDREHVRVAAVDLSAQVLAEVAETNEVEADGLDVLRETARLVRAVLETIDKPLTRVVGVGVGLPGPVDLDRGGVNRLASVRRWAGVNARDELSRWLGGTLVFPDNDSNFGALGELHYGAGRGVENLIYVRVGPGIGGGIVIDGRLYRGDVGYAGEVGHLRAVEGGERCTCGRTGCLSTVAASWAIVDRVAETHGPGLDVQQVLGLAAGGDEPARTALHDAGAQLGGVLGGVVGALNPALVILGGDVGAHSPEFLEAAALAMSAEVPRTTAASVRVVHAALGARSEVLGAAARVLSDENRLRAFMASA